MVVTDVKPRRKGLSAIFLDGAFAAELDSQILTENRIVTGKELSGEKLRELIEQSEERRAKEKALRLLSFRDHSKKELQDKLRRTCDGEAAEKAAERMEELGLLNDEKFAERFARKLLIEKKMTRRAAMLEMKRKGIDSETAEAALEDVDVDYRENIRAILQKKYRDINDEKTRRRAVAALQRLGYDWEDIRAVMDSE